MTNKCLDIASIVNLQLNNINYWKANSIKITQENFLKLVEENHAHNFQIWHAEDRARRNDRGFEFVYLAKREIDDYNQRRNDLIEMMDAWLFQHLNPASPKVCPVHSETPGMIIDRLSILALKIYHMHQQSERIEVDEEHRQVCHQKWTIFCDQHKQLVDCLEKLIEEINFKQRTFSLYYQYKMYNSPNLNPELYNSNIA